VEAVSHVPTKRVGAHCCPDPRLKQAPVDATSPPADVWLALVLDFRHSDATLHR
jgi:hypothetical protein